MTNTIKQIIDDGDKYAALAMQVKLPDTVKTGAVRSMDLAVGAKFPMDDHWRSWLGTIATKALEGSNFVLIAKMRSKRANILDGESQALLATAHGAWTGLQLAADFAPAHDPVLLTGGRDGDDLSIRQQQNLDAPIPGLAAPYPELTLGQVTEGVRLGECIGKITRAAIPNGHWRLFRTLRIYVDARKTRDIVERVHLYSRCIDGLILPDIGDTTRQFKSRTELFIGPKHHDLMTEIYAIRSADEHLNDNRYLEEFDREVRLKILRLEMIVSRIAQEAIARIIGTPALWQHFANHTSLAAFWKLGAAERAKVWGTPIDPIAILAGFDPKCINDAELGRTG